MILNALEVLMAKKRKELFKRWSKRKWLNTTKDGGIAFIRMEISSINDECDWEDASGTIDIADCSRIISLEFSCGSNEDDFKNAMGKLDILMISLGEFRGKLQDAVDAAKLSRANAAKKGNK
jgi:hypothetical protein